MKLDEQELRHRALNMALTALEGQNKNEASIIYTATEFYNFMREPITALSVTPPPSGMPERREKDVLLYPADTLNSVMVQEYSVQQLQDMRRIRQHELTVLANALRASGAVPC